MAKASEAKINANYRYQRKTYDTIALNIPKGGKDQLKALADAEGKSLNRFIVELIETKTGLKLTLDGEPVGGKK